jgi:hypothetical protein
MKRRQHSLYINRQTRKSAESPYYTFRNAFDYEAARTQRQNHEMPHDRVAEVAEFVESRTASMVATESIFTGHSAITQINTGENRMLTSMLTSRLPRSDHLTQ